MGSLYPGLVNLPWIYNMLEKYGEESGFAKARIYGKFPEIKEV
jgi:hypothetical protein